MGSLSLVHWAIILVVVLLIFGGSRLSGVMGEFAKGIKAFKQGMREDDDHPSGVVPPSNLQHDTTTRPGVSPVNPAAGNPPQC